MGASLPNTAESTRTNSLDSVRPKPAKADLRNQSASTPVNDSQSTLTGIVSAVIRTTGSQKAAALEMGIDPAQLTRQLQSGNLTIGRLEALGPQVLAEIGKELVEQFSPLSDPKDHARRAIQIIEQQLLELRQYVEVA